MLSSDILVEIPFENLPKLQALYEKEAQWAPYMIGFVRTAIRWKTSGKFYNRITIMSPNNSWEKDGTIVALVKCHSVEVFIFTLEEGCVNLYEGLTRTNLIPYGLNFRTLFYGVHEKHVPIVMRYINEKNLQVASTVNCYYYALPPEEARKITFTCPDEVYVKKLETSAAIQINTVWPHRFPDSEKYLSDYIESNGGYGIFLKSNDEMVAWVLKHVYGQLSNLQTADNYKKKGYGSLVAKVLSKETAEEGNWPAATVVVNNKFAIRIFENIGFKNIGACSFIDLTGNKID